MSKRFTDTEKWKDEWYLNLSNDMKIVWQYLLDNCTPAGVIKKHLKLLNFCCSTSLSEKDILDVFDGRILNYSGFFFIPKFLKFQYQQGLNSEKPMVVSIRRELSEKGLDVIVREQFGNSFLTIKDKDMDKDKNLKDIKPVTLLSSIKIKTKAPCAHNTKSITRAECLDWVRPVNKFKGSKG